MHIYNFFTFLFAYYTSIKTLKTVSPGVRLCSDTNSRKTCTDWTLGNKEV